MPTVTIISGDTPGNQTIDAAVINQDAASPVTDISLLGDTVGGDPVVVFPPTPADKPNVSGPTSQSFTLTVNGPGYVQGRVRVSGSTDGMSWVDLGIISAQGFGPVQASMTISSPYSYWTSEAEFTSPGATCTVTMTY